MTLTALLLSLAATAPLPQEPVAAEATTTSGLFTPVARAPVAGGVGAIAVTPAPRRALAPQQGAGGQSDAVEEARRALEDAERQLEQARARFAEATGGNAKRRGTWVHEPADEAAVEERVTRAKLETDAAHKLRAKLSEIDATAGASAAQAEAHARDVQTLAEKLAETHARGDAMEAELHAHQAALEAQAHGATLRRYYGQHGQPARVATRIETSTDEHGKTRRVLRIGDREIELDRDGVFEFEDGLRVEVTRDGTSVRSTVEMPEGTQGMRFEALDLHGVDEHVRKALREAGIDGDRRFMRMLVPPQQGGAETHVWQVPEGQPFQWRTAPARAAVVVPAAPETPEAPEAYDLFAPHGTTPTPSVAPAAPAAPPTPSAPPAPPAAGMQDDARLTELLLELRAELGALRGELDDLRRRVDR